MPWKIGSALAHPVVVLAREVNRKKGFTMRVVTVIFGALVLLGGIYCLITPIETYTALSWLIGLVMLVEGIASALTWNERRKLGFADGWTLVGAIASIALGVFLLCSFAAQLALDLFIAYLIAAWLIIGGITRIVAALKLREFNRYPQSFGLGANWGALLVLGILVALLGVLCVLEPVTVMLGVGIMLGVAIICVGVDLIAHGIRMS